MRKTHVLLTVVLLAAVSLRFWQLTKVPPSLSHDEVAIGYNAYSILKTGRDEYGNFFPLLFRSFDDYKLPGMVYVTIPSIAFFGLNDFGVRFPSAFLGSLAVLTSYFVAKELLGRKEHALVATAFFAFSIWHINFSRQLFESNGSVFFLLLGTYFLLRFKNNPKSTIIVAILYALSIYFYYTARFMLPFILFAFLTIHREVLRQHVRVLIFAALVGVLLLLPLLPQMLSSSGLARISTVSVVNDANYLRRKGQFATRIAQNNTIFTRVIYNRRSALLATAIENYAKNFSPSHIFLTGTGSGGLLYPFEIPFFFLGIFVFFRLKTSKKWIIAAWFISAPLVGAFTTDQPNALRTLPNAPIFSLISALGFIEILKRVKNIFFRRVFLGAMGIIFLFSFTRFLFSYFDHYPKIASLHFGDGYKQMVHFLEATESKYDRIYISGYYWRPYIFTLFWKEYDPKKYQEKGSPRGFDKYLFGKASWDKEGEFFGDPKFVFQKRALYLLAPSEYEVHKEKLNVIASIDGRFAKEVFIAANLK